MNTVTRILATSLVALLSITSTGCFPGITWLPDSSGFVFTAGKDGECALMQFDLTKGTPRKLVADTKSSTLLPAASPDGKLLAVARVVHEKKKLYTLQVFIYDLTGKVTQRSSVFSLPEAVQGNQSGELVPTELFWAPNNKIVISAWTESGTVAIYDIKADQIVTVQGAQAVAVAGKPFRPDGKGILVIKKSKKVPEVSFVDWEGGERPIALTLPAMESQDLGDMLLWPSLCTSSWHGNKAIVSTSQTRLEIDTDKLTGKYQLTESGQPNSDNSIRQSFVFADGSYAVQVITWKKEQTHKTPEMNLSRLELVNLAQKKASLLRENEGLAIIFPSPNGKYIAVRWFENKQDGKEPKESIWVIDQNATIVAKFKVSE
jgi:dipeptidyl aminopeptidase/acylaminoacyl peptidase